METPNVTSDALYFSLITTDCERNLVIQSKYIAPCITICYLMFTKVIGPNIMKNRKPMDLQLTMLLHNFILIALNAYLSSEVIMVAVGMWPYHCKIKHSPVNTETRKFYNLGFLVFIVKFIELFQTVIYILRKKLQQVSFLHVFHHTTVFFLLWIILKFYLIGYYLVVIGSVNLPIHVAFSLYYALAALGPGVRKYLWRKKYLHALEIVQYFVIMAYMTYSAVTGCDEHSKFDNVVFAATATVATLFINFYIRTYNTTRFLR